MTEKEVCYQRKHYRAELLENARDEERAVGGVNRELRCQRMQRMSEERAANTGKRSGQRAVLPESARDE